MEIHVDCYRWERRHFVVNDRNGYELIRFQFSSINRVALVTRYKK